VWGLWRLDVFEARQEHCQIPKPRAPLNQKTRRAAFYRKLGHRDNAFIDRFVSMGCGICEFDNVLDGTRIVRWVYSGRRDDDGELSK
jgi:hypothetical protein